MPAKKIIALSLIFAGVGIIIGFLVLNFIRNRKQTAGLKVDTTPSALVFVDGVQIGNSPLEKYFPPGEVTVKLVPVSSSSALSTYETKIRLTNKVFTIIRRDFGETDAKSSGEIITLQPQSGSGAGLSIVTSGPESASVIFDNQPQGFTPLSIASVPPGSHQLLITAPGFTSRNIQAQAVNGYRLIINSKLSQLSPTPTPSIPLIPATPSATPKITPRISSAPTPTISLIGPRVVISQTPTGFLRVRSAPSAGATEIGQVKPGSQFPLLDSKSGWYQISVDLTSTSSGWISSQYAQKYE